LVSSVARMKRGRENHDDQHRTQIASPVYRQRPDRSIYSSRQAPDRNCLEEWRRADWKVRTPCLTVGSTSDQKYRSRTEAWRLLKPDLKRRTTTSVSSEGCSFPVIMRPRDQAATPSFSNAELFRRLRSRSPEAACSRICSATSSGVADLRTKKRRSATTSFNACRKTATVEASNFCFKLFIVRNPNNVGRVLAFFCKGMMKSISSYRTVTLA
jgi:hypothetical protein